jgi:hypothetical protein
LLLRNALLADGAFSLGWRTHIALDSTTLGHQVRSSQRALPDIFCEFSCRRYAVGWQMKTDREGW